MKKIYIYFVGYKDDNDNKIKPLCMIPKTSAHVKSYDAATKWMNFFIKDNLLILGIKSVIVLKKNLIVSPYIIFFFRKRK